MMIIRRVLKDLRKSLIISNLFLLEFEFVNNPNNHHKNLKMEC